MNYGLIEARKKAGMNQAELSFRAKINPSNLSRCETGYTRVGKVTAVKISIVLGCTIEELTRDNKPQKKRTKIVDIPDVDQTVNLTLESRLRIALKEKDGIVFSRREVTEKALFKDYHFTEDYVEDLADFYKCEYLIDSDAVSFMIKEETVLVDCEKGSFAEMVKTEREKKGLSQLRLSRLLGISNVMLCQVEKGRISRFSKIGKILDEALKIDYASK